MGLDLERIAAAAVDSFLRQPVEHERHRPRFRGVSALAAGVVLGVAGRIAYDRLRSLDLERVASAVEERLKD